MSFDTRHAPRKRRGAVLLGTVGLLAAGLLSTTDSRGLGWWSPSGQARDAAWRATMPAMRLADESAPARPAPPAAAWQGSPEARLIAIYRLVGQHRLADALAASTALVEQHPTFRLAQLLHADLLAAHAAPLAAWGGASAGGSELAALRDEVRQRLAALRERPPAGAVPAEFVQLPPSVPFAIAVDASRSRLYLFENGPQGMRLIDDFYVSVGKQGVDKLAEGDQKTPLGLYFITDRIDPHALQERFGAGALPLNYPNAYDRTRGRTGRGILLHGVPPVTYSRPPQDSDGCVVLANDDLLGLAARLPQRDTPVLITRRIDWRTPEAAHASAPPAFRRAFERWSAQRLASPQAPAAITDASIVAWRDDRELMVVTFREQAGPGQPRDQVMRQYWGRDGDDWVVVAAGQVH
ncbi:L,D-transpeptidase [Ideonella sp.]|uniref:L,D-transpeptidase family protein n=1 Tax=Ideonella sp. TaxID=1929293 RepID=UPI002B4A09FC|nr:L,D-transpeptidase [Ideonella sp.]HJV69320.1 L,D-transpeptidase [Ideonella sp.]